MLIPLNISSIFSIYNYIPKNLLIFNAEVENVKNISFRQEYDNAKSDYYNSDFIYKEDLEVKNKLLKNLNNAYYKSLIFDIVLPYLWLVISSILICIYFLSYILFNLKNRKKVCNDKRLLDILEKCKFKLNIKRNIKLVYQDEVKVPAIFGIFNVRILINENLDDVPDAKIEYVFMHELSHYKRRDNLFIIIIMCIKSIYFFNPIIYFMLKQLIKDIECSTDEIAIKNMDIKMRKEYAKTLLEFTEINNKKFVAKALCISDNKKNLEKRIVMIKLSNKYEKHKVIIFVVSYFLVILMILVFCTTKISNNVKNFEFEKLNVYKNTSMKDYDSINYIVKILPFGNLNKDVIIGTSKSDLIINYDMLKEDMTYDSLFLFTFIPDLNKITYTFRDQDKTVFLRDDFLDENIKDINGIIEYINSNIQFGTSNSYELTINENANVVFKNKGIAFSQFISDHKEEINEIQNKFNLLPLSNWNYQKYKEASWKMRGNRYNKINEFFDIYSNSSYVSLKASKYPMKEVNITSLYINSGENLKIIGNQILSNYFYSFAIDHSLPNFVSMESKVIAGDRDEFVILISYKILEGKYDKNLIKDLGEIDYEGWLHNEVMLRVKKLEGETVSDDNKVKYELIDIGDEVSTDGLKVLCNSEVPERLY